MHIKIIIHNKEEKPLLQLKNAILNKNNMNF
jgi:hypothetical protein